MSCHPQDLLVLTHSSHTLRSSNLEWITRSFVIPTPTIPLSSSMRRSACVAASPTSRRSSCRSARPDRLMSPPAETLAASFPLLLETFHEGYSFQPVCGCGHRRGRSRCRQYASGHRSDRL